MLKENKPNSDHPIPQRRGRRWFLAFFLGLSTWWALGWWLEIRPQWQIRFSEDRPSLSLLCEDETGCWLLAEQLSKEKHLVILNATTGKTLYQLESPIHSISNGSLFEKQSIRIVGQILWRCSEVTSDVETRYELRAWHFTREDKERVVQQWTVPVNTPFEIQFDSTNSPYFIVREEYPWYPGLATLLVDGWTGVSSVIALQHIHQSLTATVPVVPWVRTYRLSASAPDKPRELASWTMPSLKWGRPSVGPEARWIIFGDTVIPTRWQTETLHRFGKPLGLLFYDGHTGRQRFLNEEIAQQPEPRKIVTWNNLIRVCEVPDPISIRWYHAATGKRIYWPDSLSEPTVFGKLLQAQINPDNAIYDKDGSFYRIELGKTGIEGRRITPPEMQDHVELGPPVYLQDQHLANTSSTRYQPEFMVSLATRWPWMMEWVNGFWPPYRTGFHFFEISTGKPVWEMQDVYPCQLVRPSSKHFYTTRYWRRGFPPKVNEETLEAWTIPFQFYSAWWSRGAGLLVFAAILMLRRKRQSALAS